MRDLPFRSLSTAVFTLGNAAQGSKRTGVGIKQYFMTLRRVGLNNKGSTGVELLIRG